MSPDQARGPLPALPLEGRLLAIDLGDVRIGVACSDPEQQIALPVGTLVRRRGKRFPMRALAPHLDAYQPVGVVVGLPLQPDGLEGDRAAEARAVGSLISAKTGLPVEFHDERMSTARVLSTRKELGVGLPRHAGAVDALAATVILQTFLERRRS